MIQYLNAEVDSNRTVGKNQSSNPRISPCLIRPGLDIYRSQWQDIAHKSQPKETLIWVIHRQFVVHPSDHNVPLQHITNTRCFVLVNTKNTTFSLLQSFCTFTFFLLRSLLFLIPEKYLKSDEVCWNIWGENVPNVCRCWLTGVKSAVHAGP